MRGGGVLGVFTVVISFLQVCGGEEKSLLRRYRRWVREGPCDHDMAHVVSGLPL